MIKVQQVAVEEERVSSRASIRRRLVGTHSTASHLFPCGATSETKGATAIPGRLPIHRILNTRFICSFILLISVAVFAGERLDPAKCVEMESEINRTIAEHQMPGGVLWVESKGDAFHKAFGLRAIFPKSEPMTEDTVFDIASLTKVIATAPAIMVLYEQGKVKLDEPVSTYIPEFKGGGKDTMTLRHLLTHTSGFKRTLNHNPNWHAFKEAFELVCAEKLEVPPGTRFLYSDINFITLGEVIHRVSGMRLDEFAAQEIFKPLKMNDTRFLPPASWTPRIAPTEKDGFEVLRGKVHDGKGRAMGGVGGHAGVFSTAADIARFARMLLNGGTLDGVRLFKPETVKLMTTVQSPPAVEARRGLGWDIDSDFSRPRGNLFPIGSYGMTGFTGVCLWIDPFSETFWMLLSNRVHPDGSGNIYPLQRKLATLSAEAVQGFDFHHVPGALPPHQANSPTKP